MPRIELVLDDEVARRLDEVRGDVPKATFVRRALEEKLASRGFDQPKVSSRAAAEPAGGVDAHPSPGEGTQSPGPASPQAPQAEVPLPKIAARRWAQ